MEFELMDFIESPRFPEGVSEGSGGGPNFMTDVYTGMNGAEQRNQNWQRMRAIYTITFDILDKEQMETVRQFFVNARGKLMGFRFKDWNDYQIFGEKCVTGYDASREPLTAAADGTQTLFYIAKTYQGGNPYIRRLFKPVAGTVVVYDNAVAVDPADYSLDVTTGAITFDTAPTSGHFITCDCEFDIACRFDTDAMNSTNQGWTVESWDSIGIVEIKMEDPS